MTYAAGIGRFEQVVGDSVGLHLAGLGDAHL